MNYIKKLQKKQDELISVFNQLNNDFEKHLQELKTQSKPGNILERIKTFEDACEELDIDPDSVVNAFDTSDVIAYKKLKIITRAINQGWKPDWDNTDQKKWWPWFRLSSGFGFSCSDFDYTNALTSVGSRLCFETEEKSNYVATQFIDLYKGYLTI